MTKKACNCGPDTICRKGYTRKAYTRSDGTRVKATYVPATCVADRGEPGKTKKSKKILPEIGDKVSLRKFGYSVHNSQSDRRDALDKAVKKFGSLEVLRHLNLIRNYQANDAQGDRVAQKMGKDIEYLSKVHKKTKKSKKRKHTKKSKK